MKVIRFSHSKANYGGNIYERYVDQVLAKHFDYEIVNYEFRLKGTLRILEFPFYLRFVYKLSQNQNYFLIRNASAAFFNFAKPRQGLTLMFHLDPTGSPFVSYVFQILVEKIFWLRKSVDENLLVIAKYWEKFFRDAGFLNVHLIYCPYDMESYSADPQDVLNLQKKYDLSSPLIYIGNPQEKKGSRWVAQQLAGQGYTLITTGQGKPLANARHLDLGFSEYVTLLKSAKAVVTMSKFREGWCRVAHEALLLGTPVVGSGLGGMGELLSEAGVSAQSFDENLPLRLKNIVSGTEKQTINGGYLRSFTLEQFEHQWVELMRNLTGNNV